ncbi:MAG: stage II sporulation protein M [Dehalococcoidaceae bacterium]|nr:stage II sporulation protein M [Dehalococcoidaceae bacterium]
MISYRKWLAASSLILLFAVAAGFIIPLNVSIEDIAPLGEFLEDFESLSPAAVFFIILFNNIIAIVFSFIMSPLFGIVPLLALGLNGFVIGVVSAMVIEQESLGFLLTGLLPHGIFEIPALIIGLSAAIYLGTTLALSIFKRELRAMLLPTLISSLKYLALSIALLIPAAFIETFVTPGLLSLF